MYSTNAIASLPILHMFSVYIYAICRFYIYSCIRISNLVARPLSMTPYIVSSPALEGFKTSIFLDSSSKSPQEY